MKRRATAHPRWRWRMGGYLLVLVLVVLLVLVKLQMLAVRDSPDLLQFPVTSSEFLQPFSTNTTKPKLAFLFIARRHMPLDILWEHFFQGSKEHEYSVYIQSRPGFTFTDQNTACRSFVNRQLENSVQVEWGEPTMIHAERLLFKEALQDPLNERFFLLSDSCIPLYNFRYVYDYVMSSQKSFVDSFTTTKIGSTMSLWSPLLNETSGAKDLSGLHLQESTLRLLRRIQPCFPLLLIIARLLLPYCASSVHQCFYCKVGSYKMWSESLAKWLQQLALRNVKNGSVNNEVDGNHNCIPDEHYIQTLLAMAGEEGELERRTLTYSRWENSGADWHPVTFDQDVTLQTVQEIQDITNVRYDTESRTEWCHSNGQPRRCFLFARKFTKAAAFHLVDGVERYENRP